MMLKRISMFALSLFFINIFAVDYLAKSIYSGHMVVRGPYPVLSHYGGDLMGSFHRPFVLFKFPISKYIRDTILPLSLKDALSRKNLPLVLQAKNYDFNYLIIGQPTNKLAWTLPTNIRYHWQLQNWLGLDNVVDIDKEIYVGIFEPGRGIAPISKSEHPDPSWGPMPYYKLEKRLVSRHDGYMISPDNMQFTLDPNIPVTSFWAVAALDDTQNNREYIAISYVVQLDSQISEKLSAELLAFLNEKSKDNDQFTFADIDNAALIKILKRVSLTINSIYSERFLDAIDKLEQLLELPKHPEPREPVLPLELEQSFLALNNNLTILQRSLQN